MRHHTLIACSPEGACPEAESDCSAQPAHRTPTATPHPCTPTAGVLPSPRTRPRLFTMGTAFYCDASYTFFGFKNPRTAKVLKKKIFKHHPEIIIKDILVYAFASVYVYACVAARMRLNCTYRIVVCFFHWKFVDISPY